jgi:NDP-sugar pyrophosphorylase family protein
VKAMIMAAGIGTRLRPLTDLMPKPMAPIVNRPALYHILRLLHAHGFREVIINLHHLPDMITGYLGDGAELDMSVQYSYEPELLGTAGGVKSNESFFGGDTFLIMSGDALTDVDLTGLIAAHRRYGSVATIAVKEVSDPSLYGVIVTDDEDRVVGFQEKPSLEEARSRLCNCGIYVFEPDILDRIAPAGFDDFGKRVFPDLLRAHVPFHACTIDEYWSDVGNLHEYVRGNGDALTGHVRVQIPGTEIRPGVWLEDDARLGTDVRIESPVALGSGCSIGDGAVIEGPAVVGKGCAVGSGAHLARTLLLENTQVAAGQVVIEGIIGRRSD